MATGASDQFHALVEEDLNHERAGALGRAGRRLASAIASCDEARLGFEHANRAGSHRRAEEAMEDYREAFAAYQRRRVEFCIQREANRLYDQRLIDRIYPPPPRPADLPSTRGPGSESRSA